MTTPSGTALTVEEFARRVDLACADLPAAVRHRLMADLDVHLRELDGPGEQHDLLDTLGSPEDYARDLREALDLPAPAAGLPVAARPAPPTTWRTRRRLSPLAWVGVIALGIVAVAVVIVVVFLLASGSGSSQSSVVPSAATAAPPSIGLGVQVPNLLGQPLAAAQRLLEISGLEFTVVTDQPGSAPAGTVVRQSPAPYSGIDPNSIVTLHVAG